MAQVIWNSDIDVYNPSVIPHTIARNIAKYLPIQDLLSFARASKNTYKAVNDPNLWISRLNGMGLWESAQVPSKEKPLRTSDLKELDNPLSCLDHIYKSSKAAKIQVLKIHRCLNPYYSDLLLNKPYDRLRIFKDFQTPEEQAKILNNLLVYNSVDYIDDSRTVAHEKITALFEIFENALLRELEIHFDLEDYVKTKRFMKILIDLKNQQTLIDFFLQKSIFDNENSELFNLESLKVDKYFTLVDEDWETKHYELNEEAFKSLIVEVASVFNHQSHIIDLIFPPTVPIMYKVSEELVSNQLSELLMILIEGSKKVGVYLTLVPVLYEKVTVDFVNQLKPSENIGSTYHHLITGLIDMSFESFVVDYVREEIVYFKTLSNDKIIEWKESITKREAETTQNILKHVKTESKNDFLTSFKKVFTINNTSGNNEVDVDLKNFSEIQAKAKILSENIKSLTKIFSPELVLDTLNDAKISLHRLLKFRDFSIASLKKDIFASMQDVFIDVMETIGNEHLRPGFQKGLQYLQTYNPNSPTYTDSHNESFVEPLALFFELINMADLIIQMVDIFYKEEMINRHIVKLENSILNPSLQNKKKLEALVDKYVADGLNVGVEVLVNEIENVYKTYLTESDYNPPGDKEPAFGPSEAAQKAVKILDENIDLLGDGADISIVEVFQQEIAERFFQIIVKSLKKSTISVTGATKLISDLNLYYEFIVGNIKSNKRLVVPLYQSLKKVGNIYLISGDDSKAIGKLVSDLSKFNGIFGQEEIYEFVQRRQDWPIIKRHVEKVMYGFGLGDCTIM
ncbi:F-box protein: endocytic membrane traffic, recycling recycling 1 [Scheffersomyces xylosifermentans]|uniref:F-box protein: endocytic membrane traffic, recycling recycling 1 n=1 Tax=Scheffersomyces xylosifermentans TaxID=1304137 RepID=UPI00315D7E06